MGHSRLGTIPKTRKWKQLVALMAGGPGDDVGAAQPLSGQVERIAAQSLALTQAGLDAAVDDKGLRYTFYLLTQLVLSAREPDWQRQLEVFGVHIANDSTLFDLTAQVQGAIDDYLSTFGRPTDVSEIAQRAAGEALSTLAGPKADTLFGTGAQEVQLALRGLSTKKGFSDLGQEFFASFTSHFLNFYLSRATAAQTGGQTLQQLGDLTTFNRALLAHCRQSARIVHDFCGEWYSKTEFTRGITLENTSGFMSTALRKLQSELQQQGAVS